MAGNEGWGKKQMEKLQKALDEYEQGIGLPAVKPHNEAERYLNMNYDGINKLTPEELQAGAILLAQFSFHLQRSYNNELARSNWAESETKKIIAPDIKQYQGSSYEERKMLAIKENDIASQLQSIHVYAKARAERLAYLASRVEFLAKTFADMRHTKRKEYAQ